MVPIKLSAGKEWGCDHREWFVDPAGKAEGMVNWESNTETYILPYVK